MEELTFTLKDLITILVFAGGIFVGYWKTLDSIKLLIQDLKDQFHEDLNSYKKDTDRRINEVEKRIEVLRQMQAQDDKIFQEIKLQLEELTKKLNEFMLNVVSHIGLKNGK